MEALLHLQGDADSALTPLFLIHPISGLALSYMTLGDLSEDSERPVYGINSPTYSKKSYRLPTSLHGLALEYVSIIRRNVQPVGPYLIGGWSMGGMIAMHMANILEAQHQEVIHVVLIDAMNPDATPVFSSAEEHENCTTLTFNRLTQSIKAPARPRIRTFDSTSSTVTVTSLASSTDSQRNFSATDLHNLTKAQNQFGKEVVVEVREVLDEDYDSDSCSDTYSDDSTTHGLDDTLERMYQHIFNGLSCAGKTSTAKLSPIAAPITLIKCALIDPLPSSLSDARTRAVHKIFKDKRSGWTFPRLRTVMINSAHDRVFDPEHVAELTNALRGILDRCC